MAKTISLSYEGADYTLEFTRKSIEEMERRGFTTSDISKKPVTTLPALFAGAFLAHHRYLKREKIDAIFKNTKNKDELFDKLGVMYSETLDSLMDEPEESEGNASWGANW